MSFKKNYLHGHKKKQYLQKINNETRQTNNIQGHKHKTQKNIYKNINND